MRSMTGYGEAAGQSQGAKITVQVRSLNHRHLDLQLRVPRDYMRFEEEIRKIVREKVARGRVEFFISRFPAKDRGRLLEVDEALLGQYILSVRRAKKNFGLKGEVETSLFSAFPDVFRIREAEVDAPRESGVLFKTLQSALRKLDQSRRREGLRLKADMESQLNGLRKVSRALEEAAHAIGVTLKKTRGADKAGEGGASIAKDALDAGNSALKGDIHEEVVRLKSHIGALSHEIRSGGAVGKKVEFILQEVQRELNTISAKLPQLRVVDLVLEGKEKVEKIREQSQNIE